nr:hypothetical protein [Luteibacter rhizovicinus]
MTLKMITSIAVCAALSGCAWKTQALKIDTDRYQTSANASLARGAQTGARRLALVQANAKCSSLGRQVSVLEIQSHWAFPTNGVAFVTFTCKPTGATRDG